MKDRKASTLHDHNNYSRLCEFYQVDFRTFKAWIQPLLDEKLIYSRVNQQRIQLIPKEIKIIIDFCGLPFPIENEKHLEGFDFYKYS